MRLYVCISKSVQRWRGDISMLIVTTGTVWIIQQGAPLNVARCSLGLLAFSALALNKSAWLRYSGGARVRAAHSAAPRGQGSSWQARTAIANQAWDCLAILHFLLSLRVGMSLLRPELEDSTNVASGAMKVWCTMCFTFCLLFFEKRQIRSGG